MVLNLRGLVQDTIMYLEICWTLRTYCWHNMQATAPACNTWALICTAEIVMQMFPSVRAKSQTCVSASKELPCPRECWCGCKLHRFDVVLRRQFQEMSFWLHSICRQIWAHLAHILPWGRHDLDVFMHEHDQDEEQLCVQLWPQELASDYYREASTAAAVCELPILQHLRLPSVFWLCSEMILFTFPIKHQCFFPSGNKRRQHEPLHIIPCNCWTLGVPHNALQSLWALKTAWKGLEIVVEGNIFCKVTELI